MSTTILETPPVPAEALSDYEKERGKPMPSFNHAMIQANLIAEFHRSRDFRPGSELTMDIGIGHPVTPDISLYPRRPLDLLDDIAKTTEPPVTTVEIVSPGQSSAEMMKRVHSYLAHGVKSCWLVDPPMHQVTVFTVDGQRKIYDEGVVTDPATGVTADLAAVFA